MKLKGLILGDIRQQYKYGFYALYTLFTLVYIAVLRILPMQWKELCTTTLIFSDPVLIGLMFMGAIILFEKSEKVMQALAVSRIHFVKGNFHWTNFFAKWSSHRIVLRHGTFLHTSCCWNYVRFSIIHTGWNITFRFHFNHE